MADKRGYCHLAPPESQCQKPVLKASGKNLNFLNLSPFANPAKTPNNLVINSHF
jgi:hypothetical protein